MTKPEKHIFVCGSFRASGEPQGVCAKKNSISFVQYMQEELADRGMESVLVSMTGCLNVCDRGPAMVIYPDGIWYGGFESEDDLDIILDAIEDESIAEQFVIN